MYNNCKITSHNLSLWLSDSHKYVSVNLGSLNITSLPSLRIALSTKLGIGVGGREGGYNRQAPDNTSYW